MVKILSALILVAAALVVLFAPYVFSGRNVRMLGGYMPYGLIKLLGPKKKFAVFIIKERNKDFRSYLYPLLWLDPEGYRLVHSSLGVVMAAPNGVRRFFIL